MPIEVFIATGERTALSYLLKPMSDQMKRAFASDVSLGAASLSGPYRAAPREPPR